MLKAAYLCPKYLKGFTDALGCPVLLFHGKAPERTHCLAVQLSSFSLAFQLLPQLPRHCRHNPIFYLCQCLTTLIVNLYRDYKIWSYMEILAAGTPVYCAITCEVQKRDVKFNAGSSLSLKKFKF